MFITERIRNWFKPEIKGNPEAIRHFFSVLNSLDKNETDFISNIKKNGALLFNEELMAANTLVNHLGLPSHHDSQKNWDLLKTLYFVLNNTQTNQPIFDAGSGAGRSGILKWFSLLGYKKMYAMDLIGESTFFYKKLKIRFFKGDITHTPFSNSFFFAITCLSVIEHGVNLEDFFREMSRILAPKGILIITTDYWSEPVNCHGIYPYGDALGEMQVFGPRDIENMVERAGRFNLHLIAPLDLHTEEKCVIWDRVNRSFTFFFLCFIKGKK